MKTIPTLWPGHIVRPGSASRDYCMQCDSYSHLLRVTQDRGCCGPVTHGQVHLLGFFSCSQDAQCLIVAEIKFSSSEQRREELRAGWAGTAVPLGGTFLGALSSLWERRRRWRNNLSPELQRQAEKTCEKFKKVGSLARPPAGPSATCSGAAEQLWHRSYTHSLVSWWHRYTLSGAWCPTMAPRKLQMEQRCWSQGRVFCFKTSVLRSVRLSLGRGSRRISKQPAWAKRAQYWKQLRLAGRLHAAFVRSRLLTCTVHTTMAAVFGDNAADVDRGKDDW